MAKKPYSMRFRARTDNPHRYLLDGIPPGLWTAAQKKARGAHASMRLVLLSLLEAWVKDEPHRLAEAAEGAPDKP